MSRCPDTFGLAPNEQPASSRQFVASTPTMSKQMNAFAIGKGRYGVRVAMFALMLVMVVGLVNRRSHGVAIAVAGLVALSVSGVAGTAYVWWRSLRKVVIGVTSDGLTINRGRDAFSFVNAKLRPWVNMGVALHLQCGSQRFVLCGRDRRIAPTTRLEAPPVQSVDAWLWVAEFDELVAMGGRRRRARTGKRHSVSAVSQPLFGRTDGVVCIPETTSTSAIALEAEPVPWRGQRRDAGDRRERRWAQWLGFACRSYCYTGNFSAG